MKYIYEPRASTIIYNMLIARADSYPWILPANVCPIVPIIFLKANIPFEFVDISASIFHMDLDQVEGRIKKRKFGGVLYVHTYGDSSTPSEFFNSLKNIDPDIFILDDRCLCIPSFDSEEPVDLTLYSTSSAKIVDLGSGGYALVKDDFKYLSVLLPFDKQDLFEIESSYKETVQKRKTFTYTDSNWLETAVLVHAWYDYREKIESELKISLDHRTKLNTLYQELLPWEIRLPQAYQIWRFNIRVKNQGKVLQAIFNDGLFASSHYASLAGIMAEGFAPRAEMFANKIVNLFNDHYFDLQKVERICKVILENYEG